MFDGDSDFSCDGLLDRKAGTSASWPYENLSIPTQASSRLKWPPWDLLCRVDQLDQLLIR